MATLQTKADSVKSALASGTCTSTTVSALSELLISKAPLIDEKDAEGSRVGARGRVATQTKTTKVARPASRGAALKTRPEAGAASTLPSKEKAILATEVINASLKALSASTAPSSVAKRPPSSRENAEHPTRQALKRSNSLPPSPLQPRSLNRVTSSPAVAKCATRSSSSSSNAALYTPGQKAIAECCRIAFSCLRALQSSQPPRVDLPPLQLETGMSALIGKVVNIGLEELAMKELRILKKRLDFHINCKESPVLKRLTTKDNSAQTVVAGAGLDELLDFDTIPTDEHLLNLAIATQLQVLKLLTTSKKPSVITTAILKLHPEYPTSPTQLLLHSARSSPANTSKVVRQLEVVTQLLLSLGPPISTSEDALAKAHIPPDLALQVQTYALLNRWMWWKLEGHQGDADVEIWEPYSKCLTAFARRSQGRLADSYTCAEATFATLSAAASTKINQVLPDKPRLYTVYKCLGSLAQDCGNFKDAIRWVEMLQHFTVSSEVQRNTICTKLLILRLKANPRDSHIPSLLERVVAAMESSLKGESGELDELLAETFKARKVALALLPSKTADAGECAIDTRTRILSELMILQCPRFALRYLGQTPSSNAGTRDILRFNQRRQLVSKMAPSMVESSLYLVKSMRTDVGELPAWEKMDSYMRDCLQLLEVIDDAASDSADAGDMARTSYYVRISNQYFAQHLDMRRDSTGLKDLHHLRPLRRAIDTVRYRSRAERKTAGMCLRLERMADILRASGQLKEAKDCLLILRDELVGNNALQAVEVAATTLSIPKAFAHNDDSSLLARTFASLVKVDRRRCPKAVQDISVLEECWTPAEKGAVLEHTMAMLPNESFDTTSLQYSLYKKLLCFYDARVYPVRRLRIICGFVRFNPHLRREIFEEARNTIALTAVDGLIESSEDSKLQPFAPHLQSLLSSRMELLEEHPRIDLIRPHLASWCIVVEKSKESDSLLRQVDDLNDFLDHLYSVADFLDMKGFATLRVAVLRMIANINDLSREQSPDEIVLSYSFLAAQYLDLGYSGKAGLALDRALHCSQLTNPIICLRRLVTHADYLLRIGNLDKCEEALHRAYGIASKDNEAMIIKRHDSDRDSFDRVLADASITLSELSLQRGKPQEALLHSKRSLRIVARAWKKAEKKHETRTQPNKSSDESIMDQTTDGVSQLSLATAAPGTASRPSDIIGVSSWGLVKPMFRCFVHLSQVYAHHGMFQDTIYYAEQAHKIAANMDSMNYVAEALAAMGSTWLRADTIDKAAEYLIQAKDISSIYREPQATVALKSELSKLYQRQGFQKAEISACSEAESTLTTLMDPVYINQLDRILDAAAALQAEMSRLTIEKRKKETILPAKRIISRRKAPVKAGDVTKVAAEPTTSTAEQCLPLMSIKGSILRQKARSLIKWERSKIDEVANVLREAGSCWLSTLDAIDDRITLAEHLFHQCSLLLPSDPVYSVLQDSTISHPAVLAAKASTSERLSNIRTPPRKTPIARRNMSQSKASTWSELLKQAHENLVEAYSMASQISSTRIMTHVASFLNTTSVLLSTYHGTKIRTAHPGASSAVQEMAKILSIERERNAIFADASALVSKADDLKWPQVLMPDDHREYARLSAQAAVFQADYIDIIPAAWNVVSITLSESRQELVLTRYGTGHSPFIVRVPLERNASREADEEEFGFDQGRAEMLEIIAHANSSAHAGQEATSKVAKAKWWKDRDDLNRRLSELLQNIENVWLGGFRGVFAQQARQPSHLARFQKSFQNTLDKHLPSRQRGNRRTKASPRVTLDPRILELFVGLGDPFGENVELEEPLTDLLYFVVDILQFHGERNAYDEIDFDSLVLDTLDALRAYHQALNGSDARKDSHTVLILDKSLHCFPWESLPCMKGQAVSRLPSMGCLRDRILAQSKQVAQGRPEGVYVNRAKGAYILNPGQDLQSTQTTFEEELLQLEGWNSIVNQAPAEEEVKEILEKDDLYLYFGHGSGAQYIRSKTIKKLLRCATTFLMGCSSATLTDVGEFSVYGPAMSYVIAGSPAVVGTLWDVTDKDIDRFAKSTFEEWELYEKEKLAVVEQVVPKTPRRGRRTTVTIKEEDIDLHDAGQKKSLVQAVAKGKEACHYEYLTAAAVVVYGVPVYFE